MQLSKAAKSSLRKGSRRDPQGPHRRERWQDVCEGDKARIERNIAKLSSRRCDTQLPKSILSIIMYLEHIKANKNVKHLRANLGGYLWISIYQTLNI
jgi:hypothetical protein